MFLRRTLSSFLCKSHGLAQIRGLSLSAGRWSQNVQEKQPQEEDVQPQKSDEKTSQTQNPEDVFAPYRFIYPEFLPDPNLAHRNRVREKMERTDMLKRRSQIEIPEFYPGSIMKVKVSDKYAPGKTSTFVGICLFRGGTGLRAHFCLRNHIDGQGVEILYDMYNPTIQSIRVLRLEKRLDDNLLYLRDTHPSHSTFPMDMQEELKPQIVPINPIKVRLNPMPWSRKWQLWDLKGVEEGYMDMLRYGYPIDDYNDRRRYESWRKVEGNPLRRFDLMRNYRNTIPVEEQTEIYSSVGSELAKLTQTLKKQKRQRTFTRPEKIV